MSGTLLQPLELNPSQPLLVCIHGGGCNGGYFDLGERSTAKVALARGMAVLLVDRPGHAGNPPLSTDRPLAASVPLIRRFIDAVRQDCFAAATDLVMIGHSMGGAVALMAAAPEASWPLRAVAVSGIGDEPAPEVKDWKPEDAAETVRPERSAVALFFGPEGTYSWQAPLALRRVAEPWRVADVMEMLRIWPSQWPQVARRVRVPVQLRLAEHDRMWRTGPQVIERMEGALSGSARVDAALLAEGGHLYEVHKRGAELVQSQIEFLTGGEAA